MTSKWKNGAAFAAIGLLASQPLAVQAQEVVLRSSDDNVTLSGDLLDFDGKVYKLQTVFGVVEVDALIAQCFGEACPQDASATSATDAEPKQAAAIMAAGDSGALGALLPAITQSFADDIAATLRKDEADGSLNISASDGRELLDVQVKAGGRDTGASALRSDGVNLVLTREKSDVMDGAVVALDGVVVITSPRNPLRAISTKALGDIFAGRITNWSQIGLPNAPIKVLTPSTNSPTSKLFAERMLKGNGSLAGSTLDNDDLADAVMADPLAIAFTTLSTAGDAKVVDISGTCGIQVKPTAFNIQTEEYPLTQRVYAYSAENDDPVASRFMEFLVSDQAQKQVEASNFIGLNPELQSNDEQGLRYLSAILPGGEAELNFRQLQNLASEQIAADRMSITFRFNLGSARLDERALQDVSRLSDLLVSGDFENKEVKFVGFTDAIGAAGANLDLSKRRAAFVLDQLRQAAPAGSLANIELTSVGYGEISPVACNDTAGGQAINRRVEVWVKDKVQTSN